MPPVTTKQIRDAYRLIEQWGKDHPMARSALNLLAGAGISFQIAKSVADKHDNES